MHMSQMLLIFYCQRSDLHVCYYLENDVAILYQRTHNFIVQWLKALTIRYPGGGGGRVYRS